ncbi:S8 family peptidase [Bacillus xiapuensis]|uniref:S8 family peptidase n=1 Tax=Bacillus xiapuensis TaxID=2014075 RepID=UPI0018E23E55|nr:S8 family serine peptidase [Bacillus xiapuensis]
MKKAIIFFHETVDFELLKSHTNSINHVFEELPAAAVELTETQQAHLESSPQVERIHYDRKMKTSGQVVPWGYKAVGADKRIPMNLSGKGVKVGILDSGVDTKHPDLQLAGGACMMHKFSPDGCLHSYNDDNGHGTHVAGVIGAKNNSIGVVGIAPQAQLYSIKVLDKNGDGSTSTIMAGIEWAMKQKIDILNISVTSPYYDSALEQMIQKASQAGIILVAAAGNEGKPLAGEPTTVQYPARFKEVIAVSSIDHYKQYGELSSVGKEVEVAAPGENIYSTFPTALMTSRGTKSGYEFMSGTSMASPYVTGLIALYKEKYPQMNSAQIRKLLQANAKDLGPKGRDAYYGYGLAQVDKTEESDPVTIPYKTDGKGKIIIDTSQLASRYEAYNVYRFGALIAKQTTASEIIDYATKGTIQYEFKPVINGKEETSRILLQVNNPSPVLKDLSASIWYNRFIAYLQHEGIISGYHDGNFRPDRLLTRGESAILIGKAIGIAPDPAKSGTRFKDVSGTSAPFIEVLAEKKIIKGFQDGLYRPNQQVTRAEMAILIGKAFEITGKAQGGFKDVTENVTGYQYINGLTALHIVNGYSNGYFRPYEKISRANFSSFLAKAKNKEFRLR